MRIWAGEHQPLVPVVPPDDEGWPAVLATSLQYLTLASVLLGRAALDHQTIPGICAHVRPPHNS